MDVLSYFLRNPDAVDTLENIARWRLLEEAIHRTITETEGALNWLVEEGYLIEIEESTSRRLYRLNPEKLADAEALVRGPERE